ncbi:MAG: hypothetical protein ACREDL_12220, partial [Bradyrhizobium sp.]
SDGTIVIEGRRFEVPSQYRHLTTLELRFAAWDLTEVHLADARAGSVLCRLFPQDKTRNANGLRRTVQPIATGSVTAAPASVAPIPAAPAGVAPARSMAPLLARLIDRQAATGLPPAYLPKDASWDEGDDA